MQCDWCTVLWVLGALTALRWGMDLLHGLWTLVRPGCKASKYGKYAVVTGATDGIGLAMAKQLAKQGMGVVLMSRSQEKLEVAAKEITAKYRVDVQTVACDFSSTDNEMYRRIGAQLQGLDVGVLVNNVGVSYDYPEYMDRIEDSSITNLINLNVNAATRMIKLVLPGMVQRKRGAIVNIGSAAGFMRGGDALLSVYAGTKAYLDVLSRSLAGEYKEVGIDVQCQIPYFVTSKLSKIRRPNMTTPTPEAYARSAVRSIGYETTYVPYWSHRIMNYVLNTALPQFFVDSQILKLHKGTRAKALKKKAQ